MRCVREAETIRTVLSTYVVFSFAHEIADYNPMKIIEVDTTLRVPPSYFVNFVTVSAQTTTIGVFNPR